MAEISKRPVAVASGLSRPVTWPKLRKTLGGPTELFLGVSLVVGTFGVALLAGAMPASASNGWNAVQEPSLSSLSPAPGPTPDAVLQGASCTSATACTVVGG